MYGWMCMKNTIRIAENQNQTNKQNNTNVNYYNKNNIIMTHSVCNSDNELVMMMMMTNLTSGKDNVDGLTE